MNYRELSKLIGRLLLFSPIPLIVVGINWFVDPAHLVGTNQYEKGIARLLLRGDTVTNIYNPNESVWLGSYIDGLTEKKDVIVLGSSRSKLIRSGSFPRKSFFNNSLSGGNIHDYIALYALYSRKNLAPSVVIIELSPWILDRTNASKWRYDVSADEIRRIVACPVDRSWKVPETEVNFFGHYKEMISVGYFQTSFYTLARSIFFPEEGSFAYYVLHTGDLPMGETLLPDGSAVYPERVRQIEKIEKVRAQAVEYGNKPISIPMQLDSLRCTILEAFIDHLNRQKIEVVLFLPPYHPLTYSMLVNSPRFMILRDIQRYFESVAQKKNVTLLGSYSPSDLSFSETDFFDGSHPTEEAVKKIFDGHVPGIERPTGEKPGLPDIELLGINNPNGLQVVDRKPFFWMGKGTTVCIINSAKRGVALLELNVSPGGSLPGINERNLEVSATSGYSARITITEYPALNLSVPVDSGRNEIRLTPLDKPTVAVLQNGDTRPLLIGGSVTSMSLIPTRQVRK